MKTWSKCCTGMVALASLTPSLWAQIPAAPAVPAAPAAPAVIQVTPAPPPKKTLLEQCAQKKADCKKAICASPLGALLNGALAPVSAFSGGIVPPFCPPPNSPNPDDLAKPPDSPEGAAAAIKKSEAEAKARKAAVRYLGTVDCHWFPEAEKALINALRGDTNECVRLEAALALSRGCCCGKKTIAALDISASGSNKDGKPSENSERVKATAFLALQHCLACFSETTVVESTEPPKSPVEPPPPATPPPPVEKPTALMDAPLPPYYMALDQVPLNQVVEQARRTLAGGVNRGALASVSHRGEDHSLYAVLSRAMTSPADSAAAHTEAKASKAAESVVREDRPPAVAPKPTAATNFPGYVPPRASEPKVLSSSAPVMGTSSMMTSKQMNPPSETAKPVAEETPRPGSLIGWLKSRSSTSVVAVSAPAAPTVTPSPKPAAVAEVAKVPPPPATRPMASAPTVQMVAVAGNVRAEEKRESDFPAPGATKVTVKQLLAVLHGSAVVGQREWAADNLAGVTPQDSPAVADALLKAAHEDSAPTVRQACVRSLMKMGIYTPSAIAVFKALKTDADDRVRLEAEAALRNLGYGETESSVSPVLPAGATVPLGSR